MFFFSSFFFSICLIFFSHEKRIKLTKNHYTVSTDRQCTNIYSPYKYLFVRHTRSKVSTKYNLNFKMANQRERRYDPNEKNDRIDTMGANVFSSQDNQSLHKGLNAEFVLYQILLNRVLDERNPFRTKPATLAEYFQPIDERDLKTMHEFDTKYRSSKAVHWYTRETCIYKILNKALRTQDIDDIIPFDKFIQDLNKQLAKEYQSFIRQQTSDKIQVYRGQFISKDEINRLVSTKGQLLATNSFLSTSTNYLKAFEFATSRPPPNDQLASILLQIEVDLYSMTKPYADIRHLSAFAEEEEILFMFGSVFRIEEIFYDEKKKLWMLFLKLCAYDDLDYVQFQESLTKDIKGQSPFVALGSYFMELQKFDAAEEHYQKILRLQLAETPVEFAYCYYGLAQVKIKLQDYTSAIENIDKTLTELANNADHILVSKCYSDLALISTDQKNYTSSFEYYDKALQQKNKDFFSIYSGLGKIFFCLRNYSIALDYYDRALENRGDVSDAHIANIYLQKGAIFTALNQMTRADEFFSEAKSLQMAALSPEHPDLSYTYVALSDQAVKNNDENKALEFMNKALEIQLKSLPASHPDFAELYTKYGDFYDSKQEYDEALVNYHKALENQLLTLSWFHPGVTKTYLSIGLVNTKKKNYDEAFTYFDKVLQSELERKQLGDLSLTISFQRIGDLLVEVNNFDEALKFYHQALDNELKNKLYVDFSLTDLYKAIDDVYMKKNTLDQALVYYNRLLDCYLQQKPMNDEMIKQIFLTVGKIYKTNTNFDASFFYYQKTKANSLIDIENIQFEKRHLELFLFHSENNLQQFEKQENNELSKTNAYQILAKMFYQKQNYDQALTYCLKLVKQMTKGDSNLLSLYQMIAQIYFEKGDYDQSLIYYYRCLDYQRTKHSFPVYMKIGQIYLKKDLLHQKKDEYDPNFHYKRRHLDQSLYYLQNLLDRKRNLNFKHEDIYMMIANIYFERQDFHRCLNYFQNLLEYLHRRRPSKYSRLSKLCELIALIHHRVGNQHQAQRFQEHAAFFYRQIRSHN